MAMAMQRSTEGQRLLRLVDGQRETGERGREGRDSATVGGKSAALKGSVRRRDIRRGKGAGKLGALDLTGPSASTPDLKVYLSEYAVGLALLGKEYAAVRGQLERRAREASDALAKSEARDHDSRDGDPWVARTVEYQHDAAQARLREAEVGISALGQVVHQLAEAMREVTLSRMAAYMVGLVSARPVEHRGVLEAFPLPEPPTPPWCPVCAPPAPAGAGSMANAVQP